MADNFWRKLTAKLTQDKHDERARMRDAHLHRLESYFQLPDPEAHETLFKPRWLVQDLLPLTYLVILGGAPKEGKTCLATAVAFAVAAGTPFARRETRQTPVLWCSYEENEVERAPLMAQIPRHENGEPVPVWTSYLRPWIDTPEGLEVLEHWLGKTQARLLVIDSLHGAVTKGSLADNTTARRAMASLKHIASQFNTVALVVHHLTKSQSRGTEPDRFADSAQILATAGMHIHMSCAQTSPGSRIVILTCAGRGAFANQTVTLESDGPLSYRPSSRAPVVSRTEVAVLSALTQSPETAPSLALKCGLNYGTVRHTLARLFRLRLIHADHSTRPRVYKKCS